MAKNHRQLFPSWPVILVTLAALVSAAFLFVPIGMTIYLSLDEGNVLQFPINHLSGHMYGTFLSDPNWRQPFERSLFVALGTATLSTTVAVLVAYFGMVLRPWVRVSMHVIVVLPMVLPTVIIGIGQALFFAQLHIDDTQFGLVLAHFAVACPLAYLFVAIFINQRGLAEDQIAASLGASRLYRIINVIIPILSSALFGAFLVAFLTSYDESVLSLFVGGAHTETLPRKIFDGLRFNLDPVATVAASLSFLLWLVGITGWLALTRLRTRQHDR